MVSITKNKNSLHIHFDIYLINTSTSNFNLFTLADTIKEQIQAVYNGRFGNLELKSTAVIKPLYKYDLKTIYKKLLIAINSNITHGNAAEADFCGLLIKLNPNYVNSIMNGANKRTIAHEIGHILGLDHPHAPAKFESINLKASLLEQSISNNEKKHNLMCQSWYIQKAEVLLNDALLLTENQIQLIFQNYELQRLNKNYHIKKSIFRYKWIGKF